MTLAHSLVNREKTKEQLIDEGFHRNVFDEKDGLPTWFLDDEVCIFILISFSVECLLNSLLIPF